MYKCSTLLLESDSSNKKFLANFRYVINNSLSEDILLMLQNKQIISMIIENNLFFNNIDLLSKKIKTFYIVECIKLLYDEDKSYVLNNKFKLFFYYNSPYFCNKYFEFLISIGENLDNIISYLEENKIISPYNVIVRGLIKIDGGIDIINKHLFYFLKQNNKLLELKRILKDYCFNQIINREIDNNPYKIVEEIVSEKTGLTLKNLKDERILDTLKIIIDELLINECKSYHDIIKLGDGGYSSAFLIGEKVLKIGIPRQYFNIKNNKRFLKPLYRQNIKSVLNDRILFCIEIAQMVDTSNITSEDSYKIYKELRNEGLVWLDCKEDNLGRLIKDNKIYFNEDINPSLEATGYLTENNEVLPRNELAILDNDYILTEEEFNKLKNNGNLDEIIDDIDLINSLEVRYQSEKIR